MNKDIRSGRPHDEKMIGPLGLIAPTTATLNRLTGKCVTQKSPRSTDSELRTSPRFTPLRFDFICSPALPSTGKTDFLRMATPDYG